jgi:gamma-glutamyl:cysteine ligase YbdK (ATP-grasp superfamily)
MNPLGLLLSLALAVASPFCDGFRAGFTAAYCSGHQFCTSAPVPACQEEGTYSEGYQAGYEAGLAAHGCDHAPCGGAR